MADIPGAFIGIGTSIVARVEQVRVNKFFCKKLAEQCTKVQQLLESNSYDTLSSSQLEDLLKIVSDCMADITRENISAPAPLLDSPMDIIEPAHLVQMTQVGSFPLGTIYNGTYNGQPVYIREIRKDIKGVFLDNIKECLDLNNLLLDNQYILKVLGVCEGYKIVTEAPVRGPLSSFVIHGALQKVVIARMVADALMYMHDIGDDDGTVIHRDIRAANILLDDGPDGLVPKVTGFEMCKVIKKTGKEPAIDDYYKKWWSLERVNKQGSTRMSDVYAFGVLMYEISTGEEPEFDRPLAEMERMRICSEYTRLMESCLDARFDVRPTMDEVLNQLIKIETRLSLNPTREP
ncbi:hypothetical protein BG006_005520 [Podila minutissima]|uniref:Protein kinase domain-containing protein n=1 Tax=Podila minutissima TaxID=64525 RepID=A0A9P5VM11_9FUNG|nr:hypothetical protein BG006_005520 [Podila minutissima]